jgi:uncharacterized SAM-binding protein YcdF (DUF218 family)
MWLLAWAAAQFLIVSRPLAHADAIVVLSGSATYKERSRRAAQLYREGRSGKIVVTNDNRQGGWNSAEQRNPYFYESTVAELRSGGVSEQDIEVVSPPVSSTYEEAVVLRRYSDEHGLRSILIVTSSYHSRRALWTFRRLFNNSDVQIGLEPVPVGIQTPRPATWWLHPRGWVLVPNEYLKMVYYWLRYR